MIHDEHAHTIVTDRIAEPGEEPPDGELVMWVVYRNPRDYPDQYVVRRHWPEHGHVVAEREPRAVSPVYQWAVRRIPAGLVRILRCPSDDPVIVETWI